MLKRANDLNFVIGVFFTIVAVILLVDNLLHTESGRRLNLYTGIVFLIFGLMMIAMKAPKDAEE